VKRLSTILITGVAGFIGRHLARFFTEEGHRIIGIDAVPPENAPLSHIGTYYRLDLPHAELERILQTESPDVCIHCAGRASVGLSLIDPASDFRAGTLLTFELLDALRRYAPTCRCIFLSSAAVYGNPQTLPVSETHPPAPISPYGFHKWQSELLCREFATIYGLPTASVRIFSAYGPGLRRQVLWDICQKALTHDVVRLQGTGQESRDFIHVRDICRAIAFVADIAPLRGEMYNVASGQATKIETLARLIIAEIAKPLILEFDGTVPSGTPLYWQADISTLINAGFRLSIPLENGIKTFVTWCRAEVADL